MFSSFVFFSWVGDWDLEQIGELSGVPVASNFFSDMSGLLIMLGVRLEIDATSDMESIVQDIKLNVDPPCMFLSFKTSDKPKSMIISIMMGGLKCFSNMLT